MMRIGEFAKDNQITVRTIRHYESLGLIEPVKIDPLTGYRYYKESQSHRLKVIIILKQLGFSLSEISDLLNELILKKELIERLEQKYLKARIDQEIALTRSVGIEKFLNLLNGIPEGDRINLMEVSPMEIIELEKDITREERFVTEMNKIMIESKEKGRNITVMVIDIDHFDNVNKDYGLKVGDAVIDAVRRAIIEKSPGGKGVFWGNITIMEHKGGDEFINWIDGETEETSATAREICRHMGSLDFSYLNMNRPVTVSIGYAHSIQNEGDANELISLADSALYTAKLNGRNRSQEYRG